MNLNNIEYKQYDQCYLEQIIELWNTTLIYDPINKQRFIDLILLDDNFNKELVLLALDKDKDMVVGFILGIKRQVPYLNRGLEPTRGWISLMFIKKEYQRKSIATKLVNLIEYAFIAKGTKEITLCAYSPNYFFPGIDKRYEAANIFFNKLNYIKHSEAVSMQRDLWDYSLPTNTINKINTLKEEGISFIKYNDNYMNALLNFVKEEFDAGWIRNVLISMQKHIAKDTILLCINSDNKVLGYCMRKIDNNDSRFGPIGVSKQLRSKGIGGILLDLMLLDMKASNINYMYFLWTHGDAQRFYLNHGVKVYRTYNLYRKEI
ncbi:MAG: GNAT family N-acetyltransferase [Erysipelotrichaceae bacterium]